LIAKNGIALEATTKIGPCVPHRGPDVPLAHAARAVHRLGLQTAAKGLRGARKDGLGGAGGEGEGAGCLVKIW